MLRSLDSKGKPKAKKDMSKNELAYLERAETRADDHRVDVALRKKTRDDARKTLGV
jgi:hypothetical protein